MSDTVIIKEQGTLVVQGVGAQGPAGATGATGATGPAGPIGTGTEIQTYEYPNFFLDVFDTNRWFMVNYTATTDEYATSTNIIYTNSITTITGSFLNSGAKAGVAQGAQTVQSFRLHIGGSFPTTVTHCSIFKAKMTGNTIDTIAILYEGSITPSSDGSVEILAGAFTSTAISDEDKIYVFFRCTSTSNIGPCTFRLKCEID
jgi:hypothetical protein